MRGIKGPFAYLRPALHHSGRAVRYSRLANEIEKEHNEHDQHGQVYQGYAKDRAQAKILLVIRQPHKEDKPKVEKVTQGQPKVRNPEAGPEHAGQREHGQRGQEVPFVHAGKEDEESRQEYGGRRKQCLSRLDAGAAPKQKLQQWITAAV